MAAHVTGLGHFGIYVQDMPKMIDFYTRILGMTLTDRGPDDRIVFLSAQPEKEHHEIALAKVPAGQEYYTDAQQISFKVGSLADLKVLVHNIREYGCQFDRIVNHGIAFGCYFRDPEDHRVEVYWSTGMDYPQPHGDPIDIDAPESELMETLRTMRAYDRPLPLVYREPASSN